MQTIRSTRQKTSSGMLKTLGQRLNTKNDVFSAWVPSRPRNSFMAMKALNTQKLIFMSRRSLKTPKWFFMGMSTPQTPKTFLSVGIPFRTPLQRSQPKKRGPNPQCFVFFVWAWILSRTSLRASIPKTFPERSEPHCYVFLPVCWDANHHLSLKRHT